MGNRLLRENLSIVQKKEERRSLKIKRMGKVIAALVSRMLSIECFINQKRMDRAKELEELEQKVSFLQECLVKEKERVELTLAINDAASTMLLFDSARCRQDSLPIAGRQVPRKIENAKKGKGADKAEEEEKEREEEGED